MVSDRALPLARHPAVVAWARVRNGRSPPWQVETLEEKHKSAVYRLLGAGEARSAVIAKRGRRETLLVEHAIYSRILPCLPVPSLRCCGLLDDDGACWLFLEEADGRRYSTRRAADRALAGRWLGDVHAATDADLGAELPARGTDHYLGCLRSGRGAILRCLTADQPHAALRTILLATARQLDRVESSWDRIEAFYDSIPRTLVHGDFVQRNARVRAGKTGAELLVLDWEVAGWGAPAADLAQTSGGALNPDLAAYRSAVRARWPSLTTDDVAALAAHGAVCRSLAAIHWESRSLGRGHDQWPVGNIAHYRRWLTRALQVIGFPR